MLVNGSKHFDMMNVVQHLTLKYYHIFRFDLLRTRQHKGWRIKRHMKVQFSIIYAITCTYSGY